ncbi:MAG: hypothetical protein IT353_21125 [Gemmatimonadaceae bacterium]|nr:hypothetical protein [Gemmatimonadaceae bacterium]
MLRSFARSAVAAGSPLLFAAGACAGGSDAVGPSSSPECAVATGGVQTTTVAGLTSWTIVPSVTDACITLEPDSHVVYRAAAGATSGRLFLFLNSTDEPVGSYHLILQQAALAGYHAIGLAYPNDLPLSVGCATSGSCYGSARLELLTGSPVSAVLSVDRANSIEHRLARLLDFMARTDPAANWRDYLIRDSSLSWGRISVAGHASGGAQALFIAQRYDVWRATSYASYGDAIPNSLAVASWITAPFATPTTRLFGLISTFDEIVSPSLTLAVWTSIGMGSALVDVDITRLPYGTTQRFISAAQPRNSASTFNANHNVIAVDRNTPRTQQAAPAFAEVWRAISFPP